MIMVIKFIKHIYVKQRYVIIPVYIKIYKQVPVNTFVKQK